MLQIELQDFKYREKMLETKLEIITVNSHFYSSLFILLKLNFN